LQRIKFFAINEAFLNWNCVELNMVMRIEKPFNDKLKQQFDLVMKN
jgi:hypothetical protein